MASTPTARFHALDACRAMAMALGIFMHAAISFMAMHVPWAVRDRCTHPAFDVFVLITRTFRMPVFFLLAGFFARLLQEKVGLRAFVVDRARRILLPFIVMVPPTSTAIYLLWCWGRTRGAPREAFIDAAGPFAEERILAAPGHLWFLYYLALLLVVVVTAARLARLSPFAGATTWLDASLAWIIRHGLTVPVMAVPTAAALYFMVLFKVDTPLSYVPQPRIVAYYTVFFAFGWLLHRTPGLLKELQTRLWLHAVTAFVAAVPFSIVVRRAAMDEPLSVGQRLLGSYASAVLGWSLVLLFLGAFLRWAPRPSPWARYISDASYWCYLVHVPIVVAIQIVVADSAAPLPLKYLSVIVPTLALSLVSYHFFVRDTFLGRALSGRRRAVTGPAALAIPCASGQVRATGQLQVQEPS